MKNYIKTYLKNRPLFLSIIRGKEADLFQNILPLKKPILDFGCGDGFFVKVVFQDFGKIDIGLDVDEKKFKDAKKEDIYKKLVFYDGNKLLFSNNYFSTIISNCVLEHVDNLEGNLSEIYRVLKPKGKFICTVMTNRWEEYLFGKIFLGSIYKKWMRKKQIHKNLLDKKEWDLKFNKAGFKIEKTIGYLDKNTSRWLDLLHYSSIPSLVSYKVFGKWILFPWFYNIAPINKWFERLIRSNVSVGNSAALFYVLVKTTAS